MKKINLIAIGKNFGIYDGRETVVIPSRAFTKKCEETIANPPKGFIAPPS